MLPSALRATLHHPALPALAGACFTAWQFYPGLMSVDSAVQYAQALGQWRLDDVHPPLLALLWALCDRVVEGPGGLFLLLVAGWWGALAACVAGWLRRPWPRAAAVLGIGLWPPLLLMLGHVWKDVAMAVALLLAVLAIRAWRRGGRRRSALAALGALALACAFRHNGIFAALPLLLWLCWPRTDTMRTGRMPAALARCAAAALLLALLPGTIVALSGAERTAPWTAVLLWDLGPLSLAEGRVLVPEDLLTRPVTLEDIEAAYVPWANVPLLQALELRLSFFVPYTRSQRQALLSAWWSAVRAHPGAYLAHRNAMFGILLFGWDRSMPHQLVYVPERLLPRDSTLALPPVDPQRGLLPFYRQAWSTALFAAAPYLLLALGALAWAWRRDSARAATLALAASAWCTVLPLWAISGSAEFRYVLWTVLAALLAWVPALGDVPRVAPGQAAAA